MPLVIFFVPDPAKGVAEMARVVRPGDTIAAYGWALLEGGFPYAAPHVEMRELGVAPGMPPSPEASRITVLRHLWTGAGLASVATRAIDVQRSSTITVLTGPTQVQAIVSTGHPSAR